MLLTVLFAQPRRNLHGVMQILNQISLYYKKKEERSYLAQKPHQIYWLKPCKTDHQGVKCTFTGWKCYDICQHKSIYEHITTIQYWNLANIMLLCLCVSK